MAALMLNGTVLPLRLLADPDGEAVNVMVEWNGTEYYLLEIGPRGIARIGGQHPSLPLPMKDGCVVDCTSV